MILPNTVFIGAPKCGTSSAFAWLTAHPECFGSTLKEPFFLLDREHPLLGPLNVHRDGLEAYGRCFAGYGGQRILCEASTHYLYQETALEVLSSLQPRPKIIVLLRQPELRVLSSFLYTRNNLARLDKRVTFAEFTEKLLADRIDDLGSAFRDKASFYVLQRDLHYSEYAGFIARWLERFGREDVHIEIFRPFVSMPKEGMQRIATFLGIDPSFYDDYNFGEKNQTMAVAFQAMHRAALALRLVAPRSVIRNSFLRGGYFALQKLAARYQAREDVADSLDNLRRHFKPHNDRLAQILNLDLSLWDATQIPSQS